jgi:S-adenosylmethionine hydrolase
VHLVTFTSDLGLSDPYVGEVKGVLAAIAPEVRIIDLTHNIEPGNLVQASFTLSESFRYFPEGTLHLVVVDPGVGTLRGIVAVRTKSFFFVGPDNGVLWEAVQRDRPARIAVLDPARLYVELQNRYPCNNVIGRLVEGGVSATFHGRDLFAPLAAYLCEGYPLEAVSLPGEALEKLALPAPVQTDRSVAGRVLYVDRFGNLVTNIPREMVDLNDEVFIKSGNEIVMVGTLSATYADSEPGKPLALIGSRNNIEIAVNRGSASDLYNAGCGAEILVMKETRGK